MDKHQILVYTLLSISLSEGKQLDFLGSNKTVVHIKDYNFYAIVAPVGRYETYCGATLISPLFLISAYHCIKHTAPEEKWQAHFEVENKCEPHRGLTVNVTRVYFHGRAAVNEAQTKDDVALLKLLREVTSIEPAKLPLEAPSPGEVGVVIGYEARRPIALSKLRTFRDLAGGEKSAQQNCPLLRKLQMVQMKSSCVETDAPDNYQGQFCSYNTPESFADCRFDSGGPWFHETRPGYKILVGVSTFGSFYCKPQGVNGMYTDVHAYRNWIDNVLKGNINGDIRVVAYDDNDEGDEDDDFLEHDDFKKESDDRDESDDDDDDQNYLDDDDDEDDDDNNEDDDDDEEEDYKSDDDDDSESDEDDDYESDEDDDYESDTDDDYESDEDVNYSDNEDNDDDDDDYECDDDNDEYDDAYTNEWVPSGSPHVVGPPFTN